MSTATEFGRQLDNWLEVKVRQASREAFVGIAQKAHESIVEGSDLTGAPGQPVDWGTLKGSWQLQFPTPLVAEITTNVVYAKPIEDGMQTIFLGDGKYTYRSPIHFRSEVGGSHSVALTVANFDRIVDHVVREVIAA